MKSKTKMYESCIISATADLLPANTEESSSDEYLTRAKKTLDFLREVSGQEPIGETVENLRDLIRASGGDVEAAARVIADDTEADWWVAALPNIVSPWSIDGSDAPSDDELIEAFRDEVKRDPTEKEIADMRKTLRIMKGDVEDY